MPPVPSAQTGSPAKSAEYLANGNYAATNAANVGTGDGHINKQTYPDTVSLCFDIESIANINCDSSSQPSYVDYNVPAGYSGFTAAIGYSNDSPSSCDTTVQIFGDGNQLFSREFFYGNLFPVTYSVGQYNRIRLQIVPKTGTDCVVDFGSARFTPAG